MTGTSSLPTALAGPLLAAIMALAPAAAIPAALQEMVDAERAFARLARETTINEAFIAFFADEAVSFEPDPGPARERLRANARPQPPGVALLWEPRLGHVAASGELGFLTGPAESIAPNQPARTMNYFSVWKRQATGEFRVILDVGVATPGTPEFAAGFTRARTRARWTGAAVRSAAETTLSAADSELAERLSRGAPADAYAASLHADARVMRHGTQPMTSRRAALAWLRAEVASMTAVPLKAESSNAGDLGYTWGRYAVKTATGAAQAGHYVRVWSRQADGAWLIAADVMTPPSPSRTASAPSR